MLLTFEEIHEGRAASDEISSKEQSKASRTRSFRATVSSPYDGPDVVISTMDPLGTPHPIVSNCYLCKRDVKNHAKSKLVFNVTATYSTDPIVAPGSPFNDPAEIAWNSEQITRIFQYDAEGKAIVNSANQTFVPGMQDTDSFWVVTIKKNVTNVPRWILNYRNVVNTSPFMVDGISVAKDCGWMKGIKIGHMQVRNNVNYRALEFTIGVKSGQKLTNGNQVAMCGGGGPVQPIYDNWWKYTMDEGTTELQTQGNPNLPNYGKPIAMKLCDGATARSKVLLDGFGHQLQNPTPSTTIFIGVLLKLRQNFNLLPLR